MESADSVVVDGSVSTHRASLVWVDGLLLQLLEDYEYAGTVVSAESTWTYDARRLKIEYVRDESDSLKREVYAYNASNQLVRTEEIENDILLVTGNKAWSDDRLLSVEHYVPQGDLTHRSDFEYAAPAPTLDHIESVWYAFLPDVATSIARSYDTDGNLTRETTTTDGELVRDTQLEWGIDGRRSFLDERVLSFGIWEQTLMAWTYDIDGHPSTELVERDIDDDGDLDQRSMTDWVWSCQGG